MKAINVGICGLGTVGAGVVNVLQRNAALISERARHPVVISHIGARRDNSDCNVDGITLSRDIFSVVDDPDVDIVVELIGGYDPAKQLVCRAIENGKHVVTANKALIAMHGEEIFSLAAQHGVTVSYEAAVAGGIPVIKALREGVAANRIDWLAGIINGTGNFILSEMREKNREFEDVLKEAQALGYAEADPTFDVEGLDAAHKLVILASIAFGIPLSFPQCYTQGISTIEPRDVEFADELGYRIKHLGIARKVDDGVELRVHPTLIPRGRLIANVDGVMNAVVIHGDAVGPTLYYGPGAGAEPTASAVIADIVDVARLIDALPESAVLALGAKEQPSAFAAVLPIEQVECAYYLRITALDKPGVLNKITRILGDAGVSIEAVKQPEIEKGAQQVPIVLITDITREGNMLEIIECIEALEEVAGKLTFIRLESLS